MPGVPTPLTQPDQGSTFIAEHRGPLDGPPLPPGPPVLVGVMVMVSKEGIKGPPPTDVGAAREQLEMLGETCHHHARGL